MLIYSDATTLILSVRQHANSLTNLGAVYSAVLWHRTFLFVN